MDLSHGRRVIPIRASSIGELFDCAARWEAKHIRGLRTPSSGNAQLGTAVHASTALYDKSRLEGSGLKPDDCEAALVDAIYQPKEPVEWDDDLAAKDAEKIGRALHSKYCATIAPTREYAAVEVKCDALEITDLAIALFGTTDRIRRIGEGFGIADLKTGKTAVRADGHVETAGHAMQMGVYELLAEKASGLPITEPAEIIGMQTGKTEKAQRIGSGKIVGARDILLGDEDGPGALEMAAKMVHAGTFPGNPRSMMCSPRYCPIYHNCRWRK
jgi:hypothetical protein